jgi:hypothetical protein
MTGNDGGEAELGRDPTFVEIVWRRIPPATRYVTTTVVAAVISLAVVVWSARTKNHSQDGGRGGGFAAFLSLFIMLFLPDFGRRLYERNIAYIRRDANDTERLKSELKALTTWIKIDNADRAKQTKALFIATAIGTLFWAFGDLLSTQLIAWFPRHFPKP